MSEHFDRARLLRRAGVAAAAAAVLAGRAEGAPDSFIRSHPRWRFVFVNHATTNPFFVPTRYGIQDACSLFGVDFEWTGSKRSDVREMVSAMRRAVHGGADGIAVSIIDPVAFNTLTATALARREIGRASCRERVYSNV